MSRDDAPAADIRPARPERPLLEQRIVFILHRASAPPPEGWNETRLASASELNKSDFNRYLAHMQAIGLLEARRVSDRRSIVRITDEGHAVLARFREAYRRIGSNRLGE